MKLEEVINSGYRFRNIHWEVDDWAIHINGFIYSNLPTLSVEIFCSAYGDISNNWSLYPEDEAKLNFNKKMEKLIE